MTEIRAAGRQPASFAGLARPARQQPSRAWLLTLAGALWLTTAAGPPAQAQTQTFKVLHSFAGYPADGSLPIAGLFMDTSGNLYGTTTYGGSNSCPGGYGVGCGTVFKLDTNGVETVLYNFTGPDGANPSGNVIMDANGDLYGTTQFGGLTDDCGGDGSYPGCGVVFKLSSDGKETLLHRFTGGEDGGWPWAGLVMDATGALYGTANFGGSGGGGVAFKLAGTKETVLHNFCSENNCEDGTYLTSDLIMDSKGNLYGTAAYGGDVNCDYPDGCGVVFELTGKKETVLHAFKGSPDGETAVAAVFMGVNGNLYGTTYIGGGSDDGTVFEVSARGKERVLHSFQRYTKPRYGYAPSTSVVQDASGNLYGTTIANVYEITAEGKEKVLHIFCSWKDCADGAQPDGDLIMDAKGNLYGTTYAGGAFTEGVIFMITP